MKNITSHGGGGGPGGSKNGQKSVTYYLNDPKGFMFNKSLKMSKLSFPLKQISRSQRMMMKMKKKKNFLKLVSLS